MNKTVYPVEDIVRWFLAANRLLMVDEGAEVMTLPRLIRLLYFTQAASMALRDVPMYDEPIIAGSRGPIIECVYDRLSKFGADGIPYDTPPDVNAIDPETTTLLQDVYRSFGQYSAWGLANLIRRETAWKDTPKDEEISRAMMKEYFTRNYLS